MSRFLTHELNQPLQAKPAGLVVADFGCGDAQIAADARQNVHSFDLVATVPGADPAPPSPPQNPLGGLPQPVFLLCMHTFLCSEVPDLIWQWPRCYRAVLPPSLLASLAHTPSTHIHTFLTAGCGATAGVTACNMAHTPLADGSVDAAVFCLALMGTDYGAFLQVLAHYQTPSVTIPLFGTALFDPCPLDIIMYQCCIPRWGTQTASTSHHKEKVCIRPAEQGQPT